MALTVVPPSVNEEERKNTINLINKENSTNPQDSTTIQTKSSLSKAVRTLISGGFAGACAKTAVAPFERVKIMFQISHKPFTFKKAIRAGGRVVNKEGVFGLWKGHTATLVRIIPFAGIQFMTHDIYKEILKQKDGSLSPLRSFIAGSMAGATATVMTYPLDLMRARLAACKHDNLVAGIKEIHGKGALYRGIGPTMAGIIPYAGTSFFVYDWSVRNLKDFLKQEEISPVQRLGCGAFAGIIGQAISYPLDTARRRMQTDSHGSDRKYMSLRHTISVIVKEDGIRKGLFKGLSMNCIKGPIASSISFTVFHYIKKWTHANS